MGNTIKYESKSLHQENLKFDLQNDKFVPVHIFKFMKHFEVESTNGFYFNNIYLPDEIIENILSYVPPRHLLQLTLVCKNWCNIIKSENFWMNVYNRRYPNKAKKLPWYVYYCYFATDDFENLLQNGNGQNRFEHWTCHENRFGIEDPPTAADPLPLDVPEFKGHTSCFTVQCRYTDKMQIISLKNKRLLRYILNKFTPHIYASEWVTGRYDCQCIYRLRISQTSEIGNFHFFSFADFESAANTNARLYKITSIDVEGGRWKKVELVTKKYLPHVAVLVFEHGGEDSKMAGGVLKILFDSIEPLEERVIENFQMDF